MEAELNKYFHETVADGIMLIGCDLVNMAGIRTGRRIVPQAATGNSWLIAGKERALLIDTAENIPGIRSYVEGLVDVPVMLALSHGHFDHIYRLCEFDEVWMHPDDQKLLRGTADFPAYEGIPASIHDLKDGDVIDLGGKLLDVLSITGHTDGSIMFLDRQTRILFSGDSIARRILYGTDGWTPIDSFCERLNEIREKPFDRILSVHDRVFLYKYLIDDIIEALTGINEQTPMKHLPYGSYLNITRGEETRMEYLNISIDSRHAKEALASAARLRAGRLYEHAE